MAKEVTAPMPGKVLKVLVNVGDSVGDDDEVITLEAMKMENPIFAETTGTVAEVKVKEGDAVNADQVLVVIN